MPVPRPEGSRSPTATAAQALLLSAQQQPPALLELGSDGCIRYVNGAGERLFGAESIDLVGRHHTVLVSASCRETPAYASLWQRLEQGEVVNNRLSYVASDGQIFDDDALYLPVPTVETGDGAGGPVVMLIAGRDAAEVLQPLVVAQAADPAGTLAACLQVAVEASDRAVLIADEDGRIEYVNPFFVRMYGYESRLAVQRNVADVLFGESTRAHLSNEWRQAVGRDSRFIQYCMTEGRAGQRYWTRLATLVVRQAGAGQGRTIVFATDVTSGRLRKTVQQPVLEALVRDAPVLDAMNLICREIESMVPGTRLVLSQVGEGGMLRTLAAPSVAPHLVMSWSEILDDDEGTGALRFAAVLSGQPVFVPDVRDTPFVGLLAADEQADADGASAAVAPVACWAVPIQSNDNDVLGVLACLGRWRGQPDPFLMRVVESCLQLCGLTLERHQARQQLEQLAFYDTLTGLPNRRQLQSLSGQVIADVQRQGQQLAVIYMDVDRLKQVNDSLGYTAGDIVLRSVAQRLADVDSRALVGRLSGDEFVLAMPIDADSQALPLVERLHERLSEPVEIAGMKLEMSVSMGISLYPADGRDMETLLHRADIALHQAKVGGAGSTGFFSREMNRASHGRLVMEAALRDALRTSQLKLHYQPQVRIADGSLYGAEALLRWQHPEWGMIGPDRFIPLAEELGLMNPLGLWVLAEACRQLQAWRAAGLAVPAVSINMSASSLRNADLPQHITGTLAAHGLSTGDLMIEVTENVMLDSDPGTLAVVREIENLGVRLSIDDFGTGYSSWGYLNRLPLDEIKLDKSFVQAVDSDEISRILSQAVVRIGEAMDLTVIAEGVETQEHFDLLERQGFDVVQGYLVARPMPPHEFVVWLESRVPAPTRSS